ncbi:MAG: hypothetical protein ABI171_01005 [Collimonas sp.]|uniref:hypothetical protein n=1 Tax=Collimonas sp. TaxID=1963772 RepID=UPI0032669241
MSLNHGSRIIANPKVQYVSGKKGIGIYQLCFGIQFGIPSWPNESNTAILRNVRLRISAGAKHSDLHFLGMAETASSFTIQPNQHSQQQELLFELNLTPQQLFALDEIQNGAGLYFTVHLYGETVGMSGTLPAHDDINHHVTLSDWARVLHELNYADILVIGVALPRVMQDSKMYPAVTLIRQANEDLHSGRYDAVVTRCRLALDSVYAAMTEKESVNVAIEKFKTKKRTMTKFERELLIVEAARHYTQPAHHVDDDDGNPEWYSRSDALLILGVAAAAVCSAVSRAAAPAVI